VDANFTEPRYKVGDLVKCWYHFSQYSYYYYSQPEEEIYDPVYGIIVEIDFAQYESDWFHDILYTVYCLDGSYRFFTEEEVFKVS
tara:strand:+ start:71 stop:325 length:255 start_codon:yes stop_codon:yes gene_type:complete